MGDSKYLWQMQGKDEEGVYRTIMAQVADLNQLFTWAIRKEASEGFDQFEEIRIVKTKNDRVSCMVKTFKLKALEVEAIQFSWDKVETICKWLEGTEFSNINVNVESNKIELVLKNCGHEKKLQIVTNVWIIKFSDGSVGVWSDALFQHKWKESIE